MMLYVHEKNLLNKINTNYKGRGNEIHDFYENKYLPVKALLNNIKFEEGDMEAFEEFADAVNEYYSELECFSQHYAITSQSKFSSTVSR